MSQIVCRITRYVRRRSVFILSVTGTVNVGRLIKVLCMWNKEKKLNKACKTADAKLLRKCCKAGLTHGVLEDFQDVLCAGDTSLKEEDMIACLEVLREYGVDINAQNSGGRTPLIATTNRHRLQVVEWLLAHGADKNISNSDRVFPHDCARGEMRKFYPEFFEKAEAIKDQDNSSNVAASSSPAVVEDLSEDINWIQVSKQSVACTEKLEAMDLCIREVFNFKSGQVLTIVQGLKSDGQSHSKEDFNAYADRDRLANACDFANDNGITVDKVEVLKTVQSIKNVTPKHIVPIKKPQK